MSDALRELLAVFDIQVNSGPLKSADREVSSFAKNLKTAATAVAGYFAIDAFAGFIKSGVELGATMSDTAQRLGVGTSELQSFQYAAKLSGASVEDANNGLKFFTKNLGEAASGNANASAAFRSLGVDIHDANGDVASSTDLISAAAEGFSHLKTQGEKTTVAMQLFGRNGLSLIPLLNQGKDGVAKLYAEFQRLGGGLDENTIKALADADDELDKLDLSTKSLKAQIVAALVPALKAGVQWLTDMAASFRQVAKESYIVESVLGMLTAAAVIAAVTWGILNFEILLIVLALALVALAVDDVVTWMKGGDSAIGRFIDKLFGKGKSAELLKAVKHAYFQISAAIEDAARQAMGLYYAMRDLADQIGITFDGGDAFKSWIATIKFMTTLVTGLVNTLTAGLRLMRIGVEMVGGATKSGSGNSKLGAGGFATLLTDPVSAIRAGLGKATPTLPVGGGGGGDTSTVTQKNDVNITINGVPNADAAGKASGDAVTGSLLGLRGAYASVPGGG